MNQSDNYPYTPGYKKPGTSQESAHATKPRAATLRARVLEALAAEELTADECAAKLKETPFSIRPRFSELLQLGKIEDAGYRRTNPTSGHSACVWKRRSQTTQQTLL